MSINWPRWRTLVACGFLISACACFPAEVRDRHASAVEAYLPTPFVAQQAAYLDAERALGPPDGRTVALGVGASIVLRFFRGIPNGPGPDVRIYEVGDDGAEAMIALSSDGERFVELAIPARGTTTAIDADDAGLALVRYVRIRGIDDLGLEPGFDLDAVEALH